MAYGGSTWECRRGLRQFNSGDGARRSEGALSARHAEPTDRLVNHLTPA